MRTTILISLTILIYSCDYFSPEKAKERVETGVQTAQSEMTTDFVRDRDTFNITYQKIVQLIHDTLVSEKIQNFYVTLTETTSYIDSLKTEMNQLGKSDANNVQLVKEIFVTNGAGEILFNKIKLSYTLAEDLSRTAVEKDEVKKSRANALNEPNMNERINQYFGLNNPLGAEMILYGLGKELLKIGTKSLNSFQSQKK